MKNVTVADIAAELGLSRNTVSKVLNGKEVPEKTKKKVLDKAAELNYKNLAYQNNRPYRILLLSGKPLTNFNFFIPIIRTLENLCFDSGHQLYQYVYDPDTNNETQLTEYIKANKFDGIICIEAFHTSFMKTLIKCNVPTVFLDSSINVYYQDTFDVVIQDNFTPIKQEMTRLIEKGIKTFGFVGDARHCLSFRERYEAMLITIGKHDLVHHSSMDFLYPDKSEFYNDKSFLVKEIRNKGELCQCYICANDYVAKVFLSGLKALGIRCPQDVKLMGFDGAIEPVVSHPTITTARVSSREYGLTLYETLILRIRLKDMVKTKVSVGATLVPQESTYCE